MNDLLQKWTDIVIGHAAYFTAAMTGMIMAGMYMLSDLAYMYETEGHGLHPVLAVSGLMLLLLSLVIWVSWVHGYLRQYIDDDVEAAEVARNGWKWVKKYIRVLEADVIAKNKEILKLEKILHGYDMDMKGMEAKYLSVVAKPNAYKAQSKVNPDVAAWIKRKHANMHRDDLNRIANIREILNRARPYNLDAEVVDVMMSYYATDGDFLAALEVAAEEWQIYYIEDL